ncbi:protein adenylyltransferase SelO family protein [Sodalis sp.]|uniref:protein adenylyltransferase SelO family protein n=1 Tax=Sodalis sp. (in: enterobacteria) TaxID=1898979 RepID=UPI0038738017
MAAALWNLNRLAQSMAGLMPIADLQAVFSGYEPALMAAYSERIRAKLGLMWAGEQDMYY